MIIKREIQICGPKGKVVSIPNAWDLLTPKLYENICSNVQKFSKGELSAGMVKVLYICDFMGWTSSKIKDEDALCNVAMLADQVTFIFNIIYPSEVDASLSAEERAFFTKMVPERSTSAMGRYLARQEYKFALDSCFCAQLLPVVKIGRNTYKAYTVNTQFGQMTTSLVALQYLEARELVGGKKEYLPLLASILYQAGSYSSEKAHKDAAIFSKLDGQTLEAIAFNFISFNNYLFTQTPFSLLTASKKKAEGTISVDASSALYNLAADGYGNTNDVEQLNLLQYLSINRKKTIDAVLSLHEAKIKIADIAEKTGLPFSIINEIIEP